MRVLILGASGQIGVQALHRVPRGILPIALSRQARPPWFAADRGQWLSCDARTAAVQPPADAWLSCGPLDLPLGLLDRGARPGTHLVVFSSTSRWAKQNSADPSERDVAARFTALETALEQRCRALGLGLTVLRPTLIYGSGMDRSLTPLAQFVARYGFAPFPRLWQEGGRRQPVHAEDLAQVAWRALLAGVEGRFDLPGGEVLSLRALVRRTARSVRRRAPVIGLPGVLFGLALRFWTGQGAAFGPGALSRVDQDQVYPADAARAALGWSPRGFAPTAATWQRPDWMRC